MPLHLSVTMLSLLEPQPLRSERLGTASFWVSALANSCATKARVGDPENTLYSRPFAP